MVQASGLILLEQAPHREQVALETHEVALPSRLLFRAVYLAGAQEEHLAEKKQEITFLFPKNVAMGTT